MTKRDRFILEHWGMMTLRELTVVVNQKFKETYHPEALRNKYRWLCEAHPKESKVKTTSKELVNQDRVVKKLTDKERATTKKYNALIKQVDVLEEETDAIKRIGIPTVNHSIKPLKSSGNKGESTCIVVASDWHVEEKVSPDAVNNTDGYNLHIARQRGAEFFQVALHLRNLEARNTPVPHMVVALLGDFITGNLHRWHGTDKNTVLDPIDASIEAKTIIKSGIDFLLKESDLKLTLVCHVGNHARITPKSEDSEHERGNSLEYFMYCWLASEYKGNSRVTFLISKSYASRLKIYGVVFRFHHGHKIKYNGGTGGIDVSANRYILKKDTHWMADYDIFGHHHLRKPSSMFFANGSMIGYNAYGSDGGMEYQTPSQTYILVNKRWKDVIDYRPIFFTV